MDDFYPHPPRGGRHLAELQNIMMRAISIHALREEGDEAHCGSAKLLQAISIHALREEGDVEVRQVHGDEHISIHALREEGDDPSAGRWRRVHNFYPRPPRGGRRLSCRHLLDAVQISIHALREEGDIPVVKQYFGANAFLSTPSARRATRFCWRPGGGPWHFYPRPPRGGRLEIARTPKNSIKFLSTPSARRATPPLEVEVFSTLYFYPRPPRGGRLAVALAAAAKLVISIHALREEGDEVCGADRRICEISIHALREEGDGRRSAPQSSHFQFLSTPSARRATSKTQAYRTRHISFLSTPSARRATECHALGAVRRIFLSTPSARRATFFGKSFIGLCLISIHALREEGDHRPWALGRSALYFYPRPPRGGRPSCQFLVVLLYLFLSTPSARRATFRSLISILLFCISIHALREEGDPTPSM